jgi:hypothetical protein
MRCVDGGWQIEEEWRKEGEREGGRNGEGWEWSHTMRVSMTFGDEVFALFALWFNAGLMCIPETHS